MIDQEMMRAYRDRWQAVAKLERRELTVAERWQQLNALLRMSVELGIRPQRDEHEEESVRRRWNRLAAQYAVQTERRSP